ncbi:MAG: hypothetical protein ACLGHQ_09920, partial [Acidimicrobiia bacterium]
AAGNPGLTVDVVLPSTVFGPIETPMDDAPAMPAAAAAPVAAALPVDEPIVDWEARPTAYPDAEDMFVPESEQPPVAPPAPVASAAPVASSAPAFDLHDDDAPRVTASDWTKMSLNLTAFKTGMASATGESQPDEVAAEPEPTFEAVAFDDETFEPEPTFEDETFEPVTEPAESSQTAERVPEHLLSAGLPPAPAPAPAPGPAPAPAPAPVAARHGEFDRPLAPPLTAAPLTQRPVAPADALGVPPAPPPPRLPGLPTRNPGSGLPDGGPDRLAAEAEAPAALEAALGGALPTRTRVGDPVDPVEEPQSTAASRLDPEALRERLRAFQTEFQSGHAADADDHHADHHGTTQSANHSNVDLGGDRR